MKRTFAIAIMMFLSSPSFGVCTGPDKIEKLLPRTGGWVHVVLEGASNMDIVGCGNGGETGLLLNYNDSSGSLEGKQMMYSAVLAAHMSGKPIELCATSCDTQYSSYSALNAATISN